MSTSNWLEPPDPTSCKPISRSLICLPLTHPSPTTLRKCKHNLQVLWGSSWPIYTRIFFHLWQSAPHIIARAVRKSPTQDQSLLAVVLTTTKSHPKVLDVSSVRHIGSEVTSDHHLGKNFSLIWEKSVLSAWLELGETFRLHQ